MDNGKQNLTDEEQEHQRKGLALAAYLEQLFVTDSAFREQLLLSIAELEGESRRDSLD